MMIFLGGGGEQQTSVIAQKTNPTRIPHNYISKPMINLHSTILKERKTHNKSPNIKIYCWKVKEKLVKNKQQ